MIKARILKSTGSWYTVLTEAGDLLECRPKGKLRLKGFKLTNPVAVGDWVIIEKENDFSGLVTQILDRENFIIRKSPRNRKNDHIIASNLDQMLLMASVKSPRTSTGFIDRLLLVAEMYHIPSVLVINKVDLYEDEKVVARLEEWQSIYGNAGYPVKLVSAEQGTGLNEIRELIAGKSTLFAGHSGVGKTTIINALIPGLDLSTKEISSTHDKGQHTTTFAEMHPLGDGGFIVDTPGIKELQVINLEPAEVCQYFLEFLPFLNECKFNDCLHRDEPGCAVKEAFVEGVIADSRFMNYHKILEDIEATNYWER